MKRLILMIILVLVLGENSKGLGLPMQADTDDQLANTSIMESGIQNSGPKSQTTTWGRTSLSPLNDPTQQDYSRQRDSVGLFLPNEGDSCSSRTDRAQRSLLGSNGVIFKWDNSTAHDIYYQYGGADQTVWDTTLALYGATREYTNETFSDTYFDGVTAAIIPMFNRGTIISPAEALAVKTFVDAGGRVLLCGYYFKEFWNYFSENGTNLIAEQFGVSFAVTEGSWKENNYTTVQDPVNNYGQLHDLNITNFESHPITSEVTEWYLRGPSLVVTNPDVKILAKGSVGAYYNTTPTDWINDTEIVHLAVLENEQGGGILFSAGAYLLRHAYTTQHGIDNGYNGSKLVDNVARWLLGIHAPIYIQKDGDFSTQAAYENWPGDGSKSTPYVIAGYRIIDPTQTLIFIQDTTVHFRITRNHLNGLNQAPCGIELWNVSHGTIANNTICSATADGINPRASSKDILIANNTIYNNTMTGISLVTATNITLVNNAVANNSGDGIYLLQSDNSTIVKNTVNANNWGIVFYSSNNTRICSNTAHDNAADGIANYFSKNNTISNNTIHSNAGNGIRLESLANNNTVFNNTAYSNGADGIWVGNSSNNNTISNNTLYFNNYGIFLGTDFGPPPTGSDNNTIINNIIHDNDAVGISLGDESDNNLIANNWVYLDTLTRDRWGIFLASSHNNTIANNTVYHMEFAIQLVGPSNYSLISSNVVFDNINGILLDGNHNWISNNTLANCESHGISVGNSKSITITNNTLDNNGWAAIHLYFTTASTVAENILMNNLNYGIILESSDNNTIAGNSVSNNAADGISLTNADNNTIANNTVYGNNGNGIQLWNSSNNKIVNNSGYSNIGRSISIGPTSNSNLIASNTLHNNGEGIIIGESSNDNTIAYNSIYGINSEGIFVGDSNGNIIANNAIHDNGGDGCNLRASDNIIANNTIYNCQSGIGLSDSDNNNIANNFVANNSYFGIALEATVVDCLLWANILTDNGVNAKDDGARNQWDNGSHGNWWGDYFGPDWNQDGIGDTPYDIPGDGWAQDRYPLVDLSDSTPPTIDTPADVNYTAGTTGHVLIWHPADAHPCWYNITRNGAMVAEGKWNGSTIRIDIDGLAAGSYIYRVEVFDRLGNAASDSVIVTVAKAPTTTAGISKPETEDESKTGSATSPGFTITLFLLLGIVLFIKREWTHRKQRRG